MNAADEAAREQSHILGPGLRAVEAAVADAKEQILADVAAGAIPRRRTTFSPLRDYVTLEEYLELCTVYRDANELFEEAVLDELDEWLDAGMPDQLTIDEASDDHDI